MTMTDVELEQFRARMEAKMTVTARFRAINDAAEHPTKPNPTPRPARTTTPRAPGEFRPRPRTGAKPCTTPGCDNLTRPNRTTTADFPGTRPRRTGGICSACAYTPRLVYQPLDRAHLVELYEQGRTVAAIAAEFDTSKTRTRRHLKEAFAAAGRTMRDDRGHHATRAA